MENYSKVETIIQGYGLSAEDMLRIMTNYHGTQLLDEGFMEFLGDEGYYIED